MEPESEKEMVFRNADPPSYSRFLFRAAVGHPSPVRFSDE